MQKLSSEIRKTESMPLALARITLSQRTSLTLGNQDRMSVAAQSKAANVQELSKGFSATRSSISEYLRAQQAMAGEIIKEIFPGHGHMQLAGDQFAIKAGVADAPSEFARQR